MIIDFTNTLIVGIDVHKYNHTAVLINLYGQVISKYKLDNYAQNIEEFLDKLCNVSKGKELLFALEDYNGNGRILAHFLCERKCRVISVPSVYTEMERKNTPHKDKTDFTDATRIAQVLLRKSEALSEVKISDKSKKANDLKGILNDRSDLVKNQTKIKNQLHCLLHQCFGDNYRKIVCFKNIFCKSAIKVWLNFQDDSILSQRIKDKFKMLQLIQIQLSRLDELLLNIQKGNNYEFDILTTIPCCGRTIATTILAEITDINQFRSSDALAKYSGIAPRVCSSSSRSRHFTSRTGNRKLNHAFFQLALMQITKRGCAESRKYYLKKLKEGKTKLHAIRCLKRRLVNIVYQILKNSSPYSFPVKS